MATTTSLYFILPVHYSIWGRKTFMYDDKTMT